MNESNKPIGVFDSGLGGLTVVKELLKLLPNENIIYLGDTARVPYGTRGEGVIKKFSEENIEFLLSKSVKAVVIACNTSSAVAGDFLKKKYASLPVFEVVTPASEYVSGKYKRVGVIGTNATIGSRAYDKKILKKNLKTKVFSEACPLFVPFIEEGEVESKALEIIADNYLGKLKNKKLEALILGCTHYPIIENVITSKMGVKVHLVNPGRLVSGNIANYLAKKNLLNSKKEKGKLTLYVTDLTERFEKMAKMFLGSQVKIDLKEIEL